MARLLGNILSRDFAAVNAVHSGEWLNRLTGDGDKRILIAPEWSGNKKLVMDKINKCIKGL